MVLDVSLDRLLFGDVLEAYSTELFGEVRRSDDSLRMLEELAHLNSLERQRALSTAERARQGELRSMLPLEAHHG
jgi:hypothetical protein